MKIHLIEFCAADLQAGCSARSIEEVDLDDLCRVAFDPRDRYTVERTEKILYTEEADGKLLVKVLKDRNGNAPRCAKFDLPRNSDEGLRLLLQV
jgi:hypothetical protein